MKSIRFDAALIALCLALGIAHSRCENAVIAIDAARVGPAINPRLYGIFLEEINHGVDGGLYAELIRNRALEDSRPPEGYTYRNGRWEDEHGFDSGFSRYGYTTNGVPFWSLIQTGAARGAMHLETSGGISPQSAYCLRIEASAVANGELAVANEGFFGIGVQQHASYALSFYARGGDFKGPLLVRLEDANCKPCSDEARIENFSAQWQRFECMLTATRTEARARLVIRVASPGQVWLDLISLFPKATWKNRPNGLRADIAQMIADLKPGFVRFPGGCVVEAGTVETAYNWKLTVGPLAERQERWGPWNYRRTQGMGLFEYFQFCEDLGAEPLYVGFCGQTCIFREREHVPMSDMGWVRDNFLDVVEYANGAADSKWGALRAWAGHETPFDLKLVEIGNENQGPEFEERYRFVHDAMKAKHPSLTYLADLSWTSRESVSRAKFDIEDQHYYNSPRWFATRFHEYDNRDRGLPPLYLGELAVTTGEAGPWRGNLLAALSEGVFLMGCERNADVVRMVSYAPLLGHVDGRTELTGAPPPWHAMIYFDGTRVFGTVSYHLWKLFGANRPDHLLQTEVSFPDAKPTVVSGQIGLGTWADTAEFKDVRVEKNGAVLYASDFSSAAKGWQRDAGRWSVENGVYRQGREGGERCWWNLGGWGNTQHAIEFNQTPVGAPAPGKIERERWYDVKIELSGDRIRCSLDGKLIHDATVSAQQKFFAVAGQEKATGDITLKAINLSEAPVAGKLKLQSIGQLASNAQLTGLTAARLTDNNTLDDPARVAPTTSVVTNVASDFPHEFAPRSFTLLRLKTRGPTD